MPHRWLDYWEEPQRVDEVSLYHVLRANFPDYRTADDGLDVRRLAQKIGVSHEGLYKWLRANKLPAKRAKILAKLSGGKLSESGILTVFVMNV